MGQFSIPATESSIRDDVFMKIIDAGAENVEDSEEGFDVITKHNECSSVAQTLMEQGLEVTEIRIGFQYLGDEPDISDEDADDLASLLEALEEDADVVNIFHP